MKKLIACVALVAATALSANAQTPATQPAPQQAHAKKTPDERAAKDADWAEQKLGLNADQKTKWRNASLTRITANDPLKAQMKASNDQNEKMKLGSQMRSNSQQFDATVTAFLTPDQKTKWEQAKQERKSHRHMKKQRDLPTDPKIPGQD